MQILSTMAGEQVDADLCRILGLPKALKVSFGVRLGYPLGTPPARLRVRRDVEDFTHWNDYGATSTAPPTGSSSLVQEPRLRAENSSPGSRPGPGSRSALDIRVTRPASSARASDANARA